MTHSLSAKARQFGRSIRKEIPWLPETLCSALEQIAEGKVVIPSLELDRELHALCLNTRVYNRVNSGCIAPLAAAMSMKR